MQSTKGTSKDRQHCGLGQLDRGACVCVCVLGWLLGSLLSHWVSSLRKAHAWTRDPRLWSVTGC